MCYPQYPFEILFFLVQNGARVELISNSDHTYEDISDDGYQIPSSTHNEPGTSSSTQDAPQNT